MNYKYVIWWDSPCKGMINVLKYFSEIYSPDSIVITGDTGSYRRGMGWDDVKQCFKNHIIVHDKNWISETTRFFEKYHDYVHIFNGITRKYFIHLLRKAVAEDVQFVIMTEAYSNLEFGCKKIIKNIYLNYYLPFRVKPFAKKSVGVFCLSGKKEKDINQLNHLGFSKDKIVPYGYWTEPPSYTYSKIDNKLHILCPGVLKKYKGVDVLLNSINKLKEKGYTNNIIVHITGNGAEKENLENLAHSYNLNEVVQFHGTLNESDYQKLISHIDVLVAPGYVEPWGIRINEAIQRGQIVICSDGLGAYYLIEESKGGFVFKSGDINDLASKLEILIQMPEKKINELKHNNIQYSKHISCHAKAKELYDNLSRLLESDKQ